MFPFTTKTKARTVKETKACFIEYSSYIVCMYTTHMHSIVVQIQKQSKTFDPLQDAYTLKAKIDAIQSSKKTLKTSEIIQIQSTLLTSTWHWISTYGLEYITKYETMKKTVSNYNELIKLITTANTNILNINHYTKQNTMQLKNISQKIDRNHLHSNYSSPRMMKSKKTSNSNSSTSDPSAISMAEEPENDEENKSESESIFSPANIETSEENIMSDVAGFETSMNNSIMELHCHPLSSITHDDHTCITPQISEHDDLQIELKSEEYKIMPIYEITESPSNIYSSDTSSLDDGVSILFPTIKPIASPQPSPNTYISNVAHELSIIPSITLRNKLSIESSSSEMIEFQLSKKENLIIDEILEKMFALEVINHSFLKFIANDVQQCLAFTKTKIHEKFHTLRDILNQRELQLINELNFMHKSKKMLIQRQRKSLLNYKLFLKTNLVECEKIKLEYKNKWEEEYENKHKFLNVEIGSSFDSPLIYHGLLPNKKALAKKRKSLPVSNLNKNVSQIKQTLIKERRQKILKIIGNINLSFSLKNVEVDVRRLQKMYVYIIDNNELNDVQNKLMSFGKLIDFYESRKILHSKVSEHLSTNSLGYKISKIFNRKGDTRDSSPMNTSSPVSVISNMRLDDQGLIFDIHSESDEEVHQNIGCEISVESVENEVNVKNEELVALAAICGDVDVVKVLSVASSQSQTLP